MSVTLANNTLHKFYFQTLLDLAAKSHTHIQTHQYKKVA